MDKILTLLDNDARLSAAAIAEIIGISESDVQAKIAEYEKNHTIAGYKTIIDWNKVDKETVTALIEVKTTPQKGVGFDEIANKLHSYPQVESVYLMSGSYDLTVILNGKSLQDISRFVSEILAPIDAVQSTATHFVMKKYKELGIDFASTQRDEREALGSW